MVRATVEWVFECRLDYYRPMSFQMGMLDTVWRPDMSRDFKLGLLVGALLTSAAWFIVIKVVLQGAYP